jgi:hypothetical protein
MSTWRPPWSAQGQFAVTLLSPTRASNSVTARRPPGPASTAVLRAGSRGPLHPATCPPIWAGRAGASPAPGPVKPPLRAHEARWHLRPLAARGPARQPTTRQPRRAEPFGPRPAPTVSTSTTREEDPAGVTRPDATTATPAGGVWRGPGEFACLVGEQSEHGCADAQWQTPRRRRRTGGARLRRNPNLRQGRLHHSALPVIPRGM